MPEIPKKEALELLRQFTLLFMKNYGMIVYENIKEEQEREQEHAEKDELKLKQRPYEEVERTNLFTGECYIRKGSGPGAFNAWRKRFIAERQDYNIEIYADEQAYKAKKKPSQTIHVSGYEVVTDVSTYYAKRLYEIAAGLGINDRVVKIMTAFSPLTWALAHPHRTNFIFRLHKDNKPCCSRGGASVVPEDPETEDERRKEIIRYVSVMQRCVNEANERNENAKEISRRAFRKACQQISSRNEALQNWTDNGTESEMLVDMLMEALLPPLRDDICRQLKGPTFLKLMLWNRIAGLFQKVMLALVGPAWKKLLEQADKLEGKIEKKLRPLMSKAIQVQTNVEENIRDKVGEQLGSGLDEYITPFVQPISNAFQSPLEQGFKSGRFILESKIDTQTLSQDKSVRDAYLDDLIKSPECIEGVRLAADKVVEPLEALAELDSEIFGGLKVSKLRDSMERCILQTIDSAAYTIKLRLDDETPNYEALIEKILKDYDDDVAILSCQFVQQVARQLLIGAFQKLMSTITEPVITAVSLLIPDALEEFLNIENILEKLIDRVAGTRIDEVVAAAYEQQSVNL